MDDVKCFFDISIAGRDCGRIVFKLFQDKCPKTCENFRCLCTGEKGTSPLTGKKLHYKNSKFHRVVRNFIIQGGDITEGNGKGGESIFGGKFADENLTLAHDEPYLLSMANRGPDTNKSQFFITTNEAPHLDGKHVVFGRVVSGLDTILKIERQEVDSKSRPLRDVIIKDCGELKVDSIIEAPLKEASSSEQPKGRKRKLSSSSQSDQSYRSTSLSRSPSTRSHSISRSPSISSASSSTSRSSSSRTRSSTSSNSFRRPAASSTSTSSTCSSHRHSPIRRGQPQRRHTTNTKRSFDSPGSRSAASSLSGRSSASEIPRHRRRRQATSIDRGRNDKRYWSNHNRRRSNDSGDLSSAAGSPRGSPRQTQISKRRSHESDSDQDDVKVIAAKRVKRRETHEGAVPGYKSLVNLDEIPEVPVNRFLQRVPPPPKKGGADLEDDDIQMPIEVDLSKFEDVSDENDEQEAGGGDLSSQNPAEKTNVKTSLVSKMNVLKPKEPMVSKSGRIMRGRGTFKFRTPSPTGPGNKSPPPRIRDRTHGRSRSPWDRYSRHRRKSPPSRSPLRGHPHRSTSGRYQRGEQSAPSNQPARYSSKSSREAAGRNN